MSWSWHRRAKSQFSGNESRLRRIMVELTPVTLTLTHRNQEDGFINPVSQWGQMSNRPICILYFDLMILEEHQRCKQNSVTVSISFSEHEQERPEIVFVVPKDEFSASSSELTYSRQWTFGPVLPTLIGEVQIGDARSAHEFKGVPDWRFSGVIDNKNELVRWKWTRGAHYKVARGLPTMQVGVVARNLAQAFDGIVTISIDRKRSYMISTPVQGRIRFKQSGTPTNDLEEEVKRFQGLQWGPVLGPRVKTPPHEVEVARKVAELLNIGETGSEID